MSEERIPYPICPINIYWEGDEDKCNEQKCDFDLDTRSCSRGCTEMTEKTIDKKTDMPDLSYIGDGRLICTVLEEIRNCCTHLNFSPILSLIEEVQILANRMENGLDLKGGLDRIQKDHRKLKKTRKVLEQEVAELIKQRDGLNETDHGDNERSNTGNQTSSQGLPLGP